MRVRLHKNAIQSNLHRAGKNIKQLVQPPNYKYPKENKYKEDYPILTNYLEKGLQNLLKDPDIRAGFEIVGGFSGDDIDQLFSEVELQIKELCEHCPESEIEEGLERNGYTIREQKDNGLGQKVVIQVDEDLVVALENASDEEREARLLAVISTILHETIHFGEHMNMSAIPNAEKNKTIGNWRREYNPQWGTYDFYHNEVFVGDSSEGGAAFETGIWHNDSPGNYGFRVKQGNLGLKDQGKLIENLRKNNKGGVIPKI